MPTVLACLRRSVERMWPPRVPTRFGPGTRLRRPKNQWNQGPLATPQAEMCPRTANSGQGDGSQRDHAMTTFDVRKISEEMSAEMLEVAADLAPSRSVRRRHLLGVAGGIGAGGGARPPPGAPPP